MRAKVEFYVYRIFDGFETVYVGKGSGGRLARQKSKFGLPGEILERCKSDDHAFEREVFWISQLYPTANKVAGGNGGRARPKKIPAAEAEFVRMFEDIERIGSRKYAAQQLLRFDLSGFLDASKIDAIREVANGPRL